MCRREYFFIKLQLNFRTSFTWIEDRQFRKSLNFWLPKAVMIAKQDQSVLPLFLPCPPSISHRLQLEAEFSHFTLTQHHCFYFSVAQIMCLESIKRNGQHLLTAFYSFPLSPRLSAAWDGFRTQQSKGSIARGIGGEVMILKHLFASLC